MGRSSYTVRELLQAEGCTHCALCAEVCPAVSASADARLSGLYRLDGLRRLNRSRSWLPARLLGRKAPDPDELKGFAEKAFRCTLCGRCEEICPSGILLKDIWVSLREDMVQSRASPDRVQTILKNLTSAHNVFAEEDAERAAWVEEMREPPRDGYIRPRAEVVYFTGCVAAYFPMAQQIPVALAELFQALEVDFTLLGPEEWCCGFPLVGAGMRDRVQPMVSHNLEAVLAKGASTVVFACPTCYEMWRSRYPWRRHGLRLFHVTEYLALRTAGRPLPLRKLDLTVAYHDPCDLGRGAGVFEPPRQILRSIPGIRLVELAENREQCRCCGGGGNLEMIDPDLSGRIARQKIDSILETGARTVVTACQQCVRTLASSARRNKVALEVLDIVQLVRRSLET
jgi:heterodisulfide reductase subunit D